MIAVLADAAPAAGLGHLSRATALACALRALGADVTALGQDLEAPRVLDGIGWRRLDGVPREASAVVVDSYRLAPRAVAAGRPALAFDDGHAPDADLVAPAGLDHAVLRRGLWGLPARTVAADVRRVLVSADGGAAGATLAAGLAAAVVGALPDTEVRLVRGTGAGAVVPDGVRAVAAPDGLHEELRAADLVLTAAGQTALEAAATGAPAVAFALVDNQRRALAALEGARAARAVSPQEAPAAVAELARDPAARAALAARAQAAVDGHGALRVARLLLERLP